MKAIVVILGLAGCVAGPQVVTGVRYEKTKIVGPTQALVILTMSAAPGTILVEAARARTCREDTVKVTEMTRESKPLEVPRSGGRWNDWRPVTPAKPGDTDKAIAAANAVSAIAAALDSGTSVERTRVRSKVEDCPVPIDGMEIELVAAGEALRGTTNRDGVAVFEVREELIGGEVIARGGGMEARIVYYPDRPSCVADRDRRLEARGALPACVAQNDGQEQVERAWELVRRAIRGDREAEAKLERVAPTLYRRIRSRP